MISTTPPLLSLLRVLSLALLLVGSCDAKHFLVYFIGGQSNGNGRADAAELTEPLASPQSDVAFYWHRTQVTNNVGHLVENAWIDLAPGSGHGITSPIFAKEFGSELTFGRTMADARPSENIAIVKYTHGGTNLHTQWSATGVNYASFIATVEASLAGLTAAGDTFELAGMLWQQGEADISLVNSTNYEANLTDLIARVREDVFDGEDLPFVVGSLSNSQNPDVVIPGTGYFAVRQAQETVALHGTQVGFVNTDGFTTRANDDIHFNAQAQMNLGRDYAAEILRLEAALQDSDGDGQPDEFEARAGTDPLSNSSFFLISQVLIANDNASLTWPSRPGNTYQIETSTNLTNWIPLASNLEAAPTGAFTTWTGSTVLDNDSVIANYNASTALDGRFNTTAFDSVDSNTLTSASRLTQGGGLTGGGSDSFIIANNLFSSSISGSPGFNFAGTTSSNQASAATAGTFFSFTTQSIGELVNYQSLSFYSDQLASTATVDVSYTVGSLETFILNDFVPAAANAPVEQEIINFDDFTTAETVTWTFYVSGSANPLHGNRYDDIVLTGETSAELSSACYYRVSLLP